LSGAWIAVPIAGMETNLAIAILIGIGLGIGMVVFVRYLIDY
jgi:hypothetical protein